MTKSANLDQQPVPDATDANASVKHVITLVDELAAVIEEENRVLARGIPASLTNSIKRKNELADAFEVMVKHIADNQLCWRLSDDALRRDLVARVKLLRAAMTENTDRLQAAIAATRRRIEAVMRAIKNEMAGKPAYGPNGRPQTSRIAQSMRGNGVSV